MADRFKERIRILDDAEIEELFGQPHFTPDERVCYFTLSDDERALVDSHRQLPSRVLCILQIGYFKAKGLFFTFRFEDVADDVRFILKAHYADRRLSALQGMLHRKLYYTQQGRILELFKHQACGPAERAALHRRAAAAARISPKPLYVFKALTQHLKVKKIVVPGYSFLQRVVSRALADERRRLIGILDRHLTRASCKALDAFHTERDSLYAITSLKHDPKDFSRTQIRDEVKRHASLQSLYRTAETLLPKLKISSECIAYYASLVDYYTVQKLQQLSPGVTRLYLLCYLQQRFRTINDNLIQAFIFQVHKTETAAAQQLKDRIFADKAEGRENAVAASRVLGLFLDNRLDGSLSFREVKRRAFAILPAEKFRAAISFLDAQDVDWVELEWQMIGAQGPTFKPLLRPLIQHLSFDGHKQDRPLLDAVALLRACFDEGRSLSRCRFEQIPKAFIPKAARPYIVEEDEQGRKSINADRYEFLVYRRLRNHLEAGDVYVGDSLRYRSFEADLIPQAEWDQHKDRILARTDKPLLQQPLAQRLAELEKELEGLIESVNRRILSGENTQIKQRKKGEELIWTLPYPRLDKPEHDPFFDRLPQIHIAQLMLAVDRHCQFLDAFTHILPRHVKTTMDRKAIVACIIALGTNVGIGKMASISDLNYQTLFTAANSFIRPETLREASDIICNATAKLPIFRHYDIGGKLHSSSDGQKLETQHPTIRSRHSPKYFGLRKGIVANTLNGNHLPLNVGVIGANNYEGHDVYDLLVNNTTDIWPSVHSTDTHGSNQVNFVLLDMEGVQYAPRYRNPRGELETLHGFKPPSQYDPSFLLKPTVQLSKRLMLGDEDALKHILASLATKTTRQSVIVRKLSSHARQNRVKKALWAWNDAMHSIHMLRYVDSPEFQRNIQQALNRGETYHTLVRHIAHANGGKLQARTNLDQQIWAECVRLLANAIIFHHARLLSALYERAVQRGDQAMIERILRVDPASCARVNLLGNFNFGEIGDTIDFELLLNLLERTPESEPPPNDRRAWRLTRP